MRKVLFAILLTILLIVTGLTIYRGFSIGNFKIWGIKQVIEENNKIDEANNSLISLVDSKFPSTVSKLNNSGEVMQQTKKEYEEQAVMVSNSKYYMQTEKYKLEFLWTRIGNYAKDNNVTPKMDVTSGSTNGVYNLVITVVGKYRKVADFIYAIENDSRLGFKIEDFSMTQYASGENGSLVQGKFTCKEIKIDIKSIDQDTDNTSKTENDSENKPQTNANNTTNTTNSNTTNTTGTNTTNTTNTQNTTNSTETDTTDTTNAENTVNPETTASTST